MAEPVSLVSEVDLARIRRFCADRIPARVAHLVRLEIEVKGRAVTIVERRPPFDPRFGPEWTRNPVARLRFIVNRGAWFLYFPDRYGRWLEYLNVDPSPDVGLLLAEIDADPTWDLLGLSERPGPESGQRTKTGT